MVQAGTRQRETPAVGMESKEGRSPPVSSTPEHPAPQSPGPHARRVPRFVAIGGIVAVAVLGGGISIAAAATPSDPTANSATSTSTTTHTSHTRPSGAPTGKPDWPSGGARPTGTPGNRVQQPRLSGTVKSVSGTTILITDRQGFTRTIVTSSKTTYSDDLTASPATGTQIEAVGTVDANGTSLDATSIGKPKGPGGFGGPGGHGPGGFGHGPGHGPGGGPRPTGSGSTSTASPTTTS